LAYIGNDLKVAFPNYKNIDDISGSFNSSTTSFALLVSGAAPSPLPLNSQQCLISVGGVLQRPDDTGSEGFRLSGGNIVFSSAPATGADFFGVILAGADYVNVGANFPDGSAAVPSITFSDDSDTGFFRSSSGSVSFSSNAVSSAIFGANSFTAPSFIPTSSSVPTNGVFLPSANTVSISTNSTERARIDSSGRLLVGTSSARTDLMGAGAQLQVEGTTFATARLGVAMNANNAEGGGIYLVKSRGSSAGGVTVVNSGDVLGDIEFGGADGTNIDTAARIRCVVDGTPGANDMPGRLVFSVTKDGASSPTERMKIDNAGIFTCFNDFVYNFRTALAASASEPGIDLTHSATNMGSGTLSFRVFTNGNVVNTNNSYGAISDIKLKENIIDAGSQWADLKALQVRKYNFKEGQTHTQIGLIAQEVELVSPGLVTESPDRDAEGNDLGTVTKSVNYSVLYMKAVKALQEAMERIETLEARLDAANL